MHEYWREELTMCQKPETGARDGETTLVLTQFVWAALLIMTPIRQRC